MPLFFRSCLVVLRFFPHVRSRLNCDFSLVSCIISHPPLFFLLTPHQMRSGTLETFTLEVKIRVFVLLQRVFLFLTMSCCIRFPPSFSFLLFQFALFSFWGTPFFLSLTLRRLSLLVVCERDSPSLPCLHVASNALPPS